MKYTENLGLKKPEDTDNVNIDDLNENFDNIDDVVGSHVAETATQIALIKDKVDDVEDDHESHKAESNPHNITKTTVGLNNVANELQETKADADAHKAENMPHQFINHKENKTYKFGFQVSVDGKPQIIYEEVV